MSWCPRPPVVAVLVNPANPRTPTTTLREVQEAARAIGAATPCPQRQHEREIETAFAILAAGARRCPVRRCRRILHRPPRATCHLGGARQNSRDLSVRDYVEAGGLMSYGTDFAEGIVKSASMPAAS